jgi:hypothetical protein
MGPAKIVKPSSARSGSLVASRSDCLVWRQPQEAEPIKAWLQQRNNAQLLRMLRIVKDPELILYEAHLERLRFRVWDALRPLVPIISILERGGKCRLCYRGSLTDGLRNAKKSLVGQQGSIAQVLDLRAFDVDAFIEVPDDIWDDWVAKSFVPDYKKNAQWSLTDLHIHLKFYLKPIGEIPKGKLLLYAEATVLREKVGLVIQYMEGAKAALAKIPGYKTTNSGLADFSLVIQPAKKTAKETEHGKAYDQRSLAWSRLGLTEVFLPHEEQREKEGRTPLSVVLREMHIEIEDAGPSPGKSW